MQQEDNLVPRHLCERCIYAINFDAHDLACYYSVLGPKDTEHRMRILNQDGSYQYDDTSKCDKFDEGKRTQKWVDELFLPQARHKYNIQKFKEV